MLTITDAVRSEIATFSYDDLDRLSTANVTGESAYTASWGYNPIGNMTRATKDGVETWYSYDDPAHAHAVTQAGVPLYGYDANGNMSARGGDTLTYDPENRLTQVVAGGVTTSYAYAGDGRRVKKTVTTGGATTTTYYIGNYYEVEVAPDNSQSKTSYYYFGGLRVAMKQVTPSETVVKYLYGDHLGSTSVATSDNGTLLGPPQSYYPYGSIRSGSLPTDYGFTEQKQDGNGLMFYQARYYDAALGRFVQADSIIPDPYNPQLLNRYSYGLNNPVKYTDPSGHAACIDEECDLLQNPTNDDVIVSNASNPVYRIILEISQGNGSAASALDRVLSETSGTSEEMYSGPGSATAGRVGRLHFHGLGASRGDRGFNREMGDDYLYGTLWGERLPYSTQLGHFLTAVDMGLAGSDDWMRLVVGHEMIGDSAFASAFRQARAPTADDLASFQSAIDLDLAGDYQGRDVALYSIFDPAVHGSQAGRRGNSMEDLRLSARGWEIGRMVATGQISTNRALANWIALNVAGD